MISHKKKAEELIEYFMNNRSNKLTDYSQIYTPTAKLYALKVCEEVLSYMGSDRGYSFWTEVKKKIEKL